MEPTKAKEAGEALCAGEEEGVGGAGDIEETDECPGLPEVGLGSWLPEVGDVSDLTANSCGLNAPVPNSFRWFSNAVRLVVGDGGVVGVCIKEKWRRRRVKMKTCESNTMDGFLRFRLEHPQF